MPQAPYSPQPGLFINNLTFGMPGGGAWSVKLGAQDDQYQRVELLLNNAAVTSWVYPAPGSTRWIFFQSRSFLVVRHQTPQEFLLDVLDLRQGAGSRSYRLGHGPYPIKAGNPQLNFHPSPDGLAFFAFVSGNGLPNETELHRVVRTDNGDLLCSYGSILPGSATEIQRLAEITGSRKVRILTSPAPGGMREWIVCDLPTASLPDVRIVEVLHDPQGPDLAGEHLAIENFESAAVDMTGWSLRDKAQHVFVFPSFALPANARLRVWTKAGNDTPTDVFMGRNQPIWNNSGDTAFLHTGTGQEVSHFSYLGGRGGGVFLQPNPAGKFSLVSTTVVPVPEGTPLPGGASTNVVDTGVVVQPNQYVQITASGTIWAGVWFTGSNGPDGWTNIDPDPKFPLPASAYSHPYCLIARIGTAPLFNIGGDSGKVRHVGAAPANVILAINDDIPGNGSGAFSCTVQLWDKV